MNKIGVFPCAPDEAFNLEPMKKWQIFLKLFVIFTILFGCFGAALWYFVDQANEGYEVFDYFGALIKTSKTPLDAIAFVAPLVLTLILGVILSFQAPDFGITLAKFQDHLRQNMPASSINMKGPSKFSTFVPLLL